MRVKYTNKKLKLLFIVPLFLAILTMVVGLSTGLYAYEHQKISEALKEKESLLEKVYKNNLSITIKLLTAMISLIEEQPSIVKSFMNDGRETLLAHSQAIFNVLHEAIKITHLYYIKTDQTVFLRVHTPELYDDVIERKTLRQAIKTQKVAYGIELGPLGTLTLRVVKPWFTANHELIGYIELGMEIDSVIKLSDIFSRKNIFFVMINKKYLDHSKWSKGMAALGRERHWREFSHVVSNQSSETTIPAVIAECLKHDDFNHLCQSLKSRNTYYRQISMPIQDISGDDIAKALIFFDYKREYQNIQYAVISGAVVIALIGLCIFLIFYRYLSRLAYRIEGTEKTLIEYGMRDGLTQLYNHVTFYELFNKELKRLKRNRGPLALLFIDIDYFKKINDQYGHQVGDVVLKELSQCIDNFIRESDWACRYGGEEFALIMPCTSEEEAFNAAERLRLIVEKNRFNQKNKVVHITISIGISVVGRKEDSAENIISNADKALYLAKRSGRNCTKVI